MIKKALLLIMILLVSGCTIVRIDTSSIDNIINIILSKDNTLYNQVGKGYKYYIPRGVSYINTTEYNDTLYSNGNYYYLYIDVVSYYHKKEVEKVEPSNSYYFRKIDNGDKTGYVLITEVENKYLIKFVYNYAKIEVLVEEDEINDAILNSSYILSTIKYNDNVIKIMLNDDYFKNKEEKYTLFESNSGNENFFPIYDESESEDFEESEQTEEEMTNEEEINEEESTEEISDESNEAIESNE